MIKIAVCDDFKDIVAQVNEYLVEYQQLRDVSVDNSFIIIGNTRYYISVKGA